MEYRLLILAGLIAAVSSISIIPNGNSPEKKMAKGMMIEAKMGISPTQETEKSNYEKSRKMHLKPTKLSVNERYRRLIPYMTFYYANDLVSPSPEPFSTDSVEVQKVQIEENAVPLRNSKKVSFIPHRNTPRYQDNRPFKYNSAFVNPTSSYTPYVSSSQHHVNQDPLYVEQNFMNGHTFGRHTKYSNNPSLSNFPQNLKHHQRYHTQKPQQNFYNTEDIADVQYYVTEKEPQLKYKLVPYEQTSHVRFTQPPPQSQNVYYEGKKNIPVPVLSNVHNPVYTKSMPRIPARNYDNTIVQPNINKLHNFPITENYFEQSPKSIYHITPKLPQPETGFRPMLTPPRQPNQIEEHVSYVSSTTTADPIPLRISHEHRLQTEAPEPVYKPSLVQPEYSSYQHVKPAPAHEEYNYASGDSATLSDILATLQRSKSIPHPITKENVGSSIRTLLHVLNVLKASQHQYNEVERPVLSTPKPFTVTPKLLIDVSMKPAVEAPPSRLTDTSGLHGEEYLAPVNTPSQHLDDYRGSSQAFPLVIASEDDGGTPGRAGVDYPTLTNIPETGFDCKDQRYKGFFADPETKCQVWHYCDLNGGQASFLCPNGTIFSQAALTCDWWFNVQCDSTHQLYVLNERLYKYILPHQPKFPEDYSGPLVDKYLTLKFKEMEEEFRKNKKSSTSNNEEDEDSTEADSTEDELANAGTEPAPTSTEHAQTRTPPGTVSEASVIVESPGNSGNVQRLEE